MGKTVKNIYLVSGPSGVGKSTTCAKLEELYGYKQMYSYTDRAPRFENEPGHVFLSEKEFDKLEHLVAYTEYNGHRYGATSEMVDDCDLYVIDPPGVEELREKYSGTKGIVTIGLTASVDELRRRMKLRGDKDDAINARLAHDAKWFARSARNFSYDYLIHADGILETAQAMAEFIRYKERNSYNFTLYQINKAYDSDGIAGCGSEELRKKYGGHQCCVNFSIYDDVWKSDVEFETLEEYVSHLHEDDRPDAQDYRPVSCSDVFEIAHHKNPEMNGRWFVDHGSFKKLRNECYIPLDV